MVADIRGKRILFFSPVFFDYENVITEKMKQMGADVDMYDVRSVKSATSRAFLKVIPFIFYPHSCRYYNKILEQVKDKDYDYILIIKCDMTPISIIKKLRHLFPHAKLCLYLWDSVKNIPGISRKFKFFDTIHSFDWDDCEKNAELSFRPLFFSDCYRDDDCHEDYEFDISFFGTVHSDRFHVIRQVNEISERMALKCFWFLYLQSSFIFKFYKMTKKEFKGVSKSFFCFDKMPATEIAKIIRESKIILDIQHPRQTGLTMRTIEMVGMNKKIITTNENVRQYDFFQQNNVCIINRNHVEIPKSFLTSKYTPLPKEIYERYSLSSWIFEVLS